MALKQTRGKQQILFNHLPGKTFDFEKVGVISRVDSVSGDERSDINTDYIMQSVAEEAMTWLGPVRPELPDAILRSPGRFVFLDPRRVEAVMFPTVFWCRYGCELVLECRPDHVPTSTQCPSCHKHTLVQMPFVCVHNCGSLRPLTPPTCPTCHSNRNMAFRRRGEGASGVLWRCKTCNQNVDYPRVCPDCSFSDPSRGITRIMSVDPHRAGRTHYAHSVVTLNQPGPDMKRVLDTAGWEMAASARFAGLSCMIGISHLSEWAAHMATHEVPDADVSSLTDSELKELLQQLQNGEIAPTEMNARVQEKMSQKQQQRSALSPSSLVQQLRAETGIDGSVWERAGREVLEAVSLREHSVPASQSVSHLPSMGIAEVSLVRDFPVTTAVYGYTRCDPRPGYAHLRPFPPDRDHGNRFPIYTDVVEADAILIRLDPSKVAAWLTSLGYAPALPPAGNGEIANRVYPVSLFDGVQFRETIDQNQPEARLVFGALHTLSHIAVRQASLLCGLDRNSLSEYVLPRALTVCVFCNHRFGATIGALTSLFEDSLDDWLGEVKESYHCVYDPVCQSQTGTCHACTHLPETSCRFFNLNLGRQFLFGGPDSCLGMLSSGYFGA